MQVQRAKQLLFNIGWAFDGSQREHILNHAAIPAISG
jgi:hypothetical protein